MEEERDNRNPDAKKVAELEIQHFDESKSVGKKLHFFYCFYLVLWQFYVDSLVCSFYFYSVVMWSIKRFSQGWFTHLKGFCFSFNVIPIECSKLSPLKMICVCHLNKNRKWFPLLMQYGIIPLPFSFILNKTFQFLLTLSGLELFSFSTD